MCCHDNIYRTCIPLSAAAAAGVLEDSSIKAEHHVK